MDELVVEWRWRWWRSWWWSLPAVAVVVVEGRAEAVEVLCWQLSHGVEHRHRLLGAALEPGQHLLVAAAALLPWRPHVCGHANRPAIAGPKQLLAAAVRAGRRSSLPDLWARSARLGRAATGVDWAPATGVDWASAERAERCRRDLGLLRLRLDRRRLLEHLPRWGSRHGIRPLRRVVLTVDGGAAVRMRGASSTTARGDRAGAAGRVGAGGWAGPA